MLSAGAADLGKEVIARSYPYALPTAALQCSDPRTDHPRMTVQPEEA
jgi:hypothetical protein